MHCEYVMQSKLGSNFHFWNIWFCEIQNFYCSVAYGWHCDQNGNHIASFGVQSIGGCTEIIRFFLSISIRTLFKIQRTFFCLSLNGQRSLYAFCHSLSIFKIPLWICTGFHILSLDQKQSVNPWFDSVFGFISKFKAILLLHLLCNWLPVNIYLSLIWYCVYALCCGEILNLSMIDNWRHKYYLFGLVCIWFPTFRLVMYWSGTRRCPIQRGLILLIFFVFF